MGYCKRHLANTSEISNWQRQQSKGVGTWPEGKQQPADFGFGQDRLPGRVMTPAAANGACPSETLSRNLLRAAIPRSPQRTSSLLALPVCSLLAQGRGCDLGHLIGERGFNTLKQSCLQLSPLCRHDRSWS